MERVYLLLRNNQQSGPFTIGELLQQQLKSSDMLWIEGKSTAWTYLSELELNPLVKKSEMDQAPSIKTSDEIEKKAEELRQRILATPSKTYFPKYTTEIETYASPYKLDDEIQFVDHRKERKIKNNTALGELLLTCFVIALFMVGIYKGKSFLGAKHKIPNSVATQLSSDDEHAARKNNSQAAFSVTDTTRGIDSTLTIQKEKQRFSTIKKPITDSSNPTLTQTTNTTTINQEEKEESVSQPTLKVSKENTVKKEDTPVKKEIVASAPEIKTINEPVKEEKKGFLRGLFKKKKEKIEDKDQQ